MKQIAAVALVTAALATPISASTNGESIPPTASSLATPEHWLVEATLTIDGKLVKAVTVDGPYSSSDECHNAVTANTELQAATAKVALDAANKFGPSTVVSLTCAQDF